MKEIVLRRFFKRVEMAIEIFLADIAIFADSLYPIFVITCILGIYLKMFGVEEKGNKISSISFLSYLIIKAMASIYGE